MRMRPRLRGRVPFRQQTPMLTLNPARLPIRLLPPSGGEVLPARRTAFVMESSVCLPLQHPMHSEDVLSAHLPLIETIIDRVCRRSRLIAADAEDFAASVKLALIENDYALLRNAAQRSSLAAYLT